MVAIYVAIDVVPRLQEFAVRIVGVLPIGHQHQDLGVVLGAVARSPVNGSPGDRARQPQAAPLVNTSGALGYHGVYRVFDRCFVVDSGRSGALVHMKFGTPWDAADGNVRHGRLLGRRTVFAKRAIGKDGGAGVSDLLALTDSFTAATVAGAGRAAAPTGIGIGDKMSARLASARVNGAAAARGGDPERVRRQARRENVVPRVFGQAGRQCPCCGEEHLVAGDEAMVVLGNDRRRGGGYGERIAAGIGIAGIGQIVVITESACKGAIEDEG